MKNNLRYTFLLLLLCGMAFTACEDDVLIMRAKHAYEWLHANDVFYDDIMASHQQIDAERVAIAVVSNDVIYAAMRNAGIHCWLYK